jgi:cellulose synthase/poly-beta-1,6-N-acetylglucosamine synthase-like glycosyltransferase
MLYCLFMVCAVDVHVDPWPGFKSGALNLALAEYTHPDAEIVGVIDADYRVDPNYFRETVGYFAATTTTAPSATTTTSS